MQALHQGVGMAIIAGFAQAVSAAIVLDQANDQNINFNATLSVLTHQYQQGITVGVDGRLSSVELYLTNPGYSANFSIFNGDPWQAGTINFQTTVTPQASGWLNIDTSSANLAFSAGDQFTIGLQGISPQPAFAAGGPGFNGTASATTDRYSGGALFQNGSTVMMSGYPYIDMAFRTYVDTSASPPPEPDPQTIYGLFFGTFDDDNDNALLVDYHGEWNAALLLQEMSRSLPNLVSQYYSIDTDTGLDPDTLYGNITEFVGKMDQNDLLFIYGAGHGATVEATSGPSYVPSYYDESPPASPGDEAIPLSDDRSTILWDDDLADTLFRLSLNKTFNTWVLLDSCFSGGFWEGDLDRVPNLGFLASAPEFSPGAYSMYTGLSYFGNALVDAFTLDANGFFAADGSLDGKRDRVLSLEEVNKFVQSWWLSYVGAVSDGYIPMDIIGYTDLLTLKGQTFDGILTTDVLQPFYRTSPGYSGARKYGADVVVPEPATLALFGLGLAGLGAVRRKKLAA